MRPTVGMGRSGERLLTEMLAESGPTAYVIRSAEYYACNKLLEHGLIRRVGQRGRTGLAWYEPCPDWEAKLKALRERPVQHKGKSPKNPIKRKAIRAQVSLDRSDWFEDLDGKEEL